MQDLNSIEWLQRTQPVDRVEVEIRFVTHESYYFGDPNDLAQIRDEAFSEPLYQPRIEADKNGWILSKAVELNVQELAAHYLDVIRIHEIHGKAYELSESYFWISPVLVPSEGKPITFPWYDDWIACLQLFQSITELENEALFDDLDQGWRFEAYRQDPWIKMRDSDWEQNIEHAVVSCNRENLIDQIEQTRSRGEGILQELIDRVPSHYWYV